MSDFQKVIGSCWAVVMVASGIGTIAALATSNMLMCQIGVPLFVVALVTAMALHDGRES